jgi:hypothetical protein
LRGFSKMALLENRAFYAEIRDQTPSLHDPRDRYRRGYFEGDKERSFVGMRIFAVRVRACRFFSREIFYIFWLLENLITNYLLCSAALFRHQPDQRKCFRIFRNFFKNFSAKKISTGKILGFSTFAPIFFGPANFRPEFFWDFKISNRKKFPKTHIPGDPVLAGLRRKVSQLLN